jgi:Protein of unknown function (DUF2934)
VQETKPAINLPRTCQGNRQKVPIRPARTRRRTTRLSYAHTGFIWIAGGQHGYDLDDWLQAERELTQGHPADPPLLAAQVVGPSSSVSPSSMLLETFDTLIEEIPLFLLIFVFEELATICGPSQSVD